MQSIDSIVHIANILDETEKITVTTSKWEAQLVASHEDAVAVEYRKPKWKVDKGCVVFTSDLEVLVVAPAYFEDEQIHQMDVMAMEPKGIYERRPRTAMIPASLLGVRRRVESAVREGLLPVEVVEYFPDGLVKVGVLERIRTGWYAVEGRRHEVYEIRGDLVPEEGVFTAYGELVIYRMPKEAEWANAAVEAYPVRTAGYEVSPARKGRNPFLAEGAKVPPVGSFRRDGGLYWVWAVVWPREDEVWIYEVGQYACTKKAPPRMNFLLVEPAVGEVVMG